MHLEAGFSFTFAFMEITHEKACLCALNRIFGFEPKIALALISHLGSAAGVFELKAKEVDQMLGPHSKYRGCISGGSVEQAHAELESLSGRGIRFCGWGEDSYPPLLKECEDAPVGLYVRSGSDPGELWKRRRFIAVVGTRDISPYGREWCEKLVRRLSEVPMKDRPVIVSGLALGTDICAHRTALSCGLPTIAVMATGPDDIYPSRHRGAAAEICRSEGSALVTDYPPGTAPLAIHFLRRNRIIAGLSEATVLIESKIKGGGMMTARLADSYNREVFALPGRIDDLRSQGCNYLIRNKTAVSISSVDDFLKELGISRRTGSAGRETDEQKLKRLYAGTAEEDRISMMSRILLAIRNDKGITVEEVAAAVGLEYSTTAQIINLLETDGLIITDLLQRCFINLNYRP